MVESALYHVKLLNDCDFDDICISIKSSSVPNTMQAYLLASERTSYPLHLGVTEAGTEYMGTIKSAAGIGGLLALGVGDTIRVSLTDDPVKDWPTPRRRSCAPSDARRRASTSFPARPAAARAST